jgi:hypothetical protein
LQKLAQAPFRIQAALNPHLREQALTSKKQCFTGGKLYVFFLVFFIGAYAQGDIARPS